jgi:beta-aspartyl-peptidase (threonine type)
MPNPVLAVHGGAGRVPEDRAYRAVAERGLADALRAGQRVLANDGPALQAVVAAVEALENCEVFNAGRGSALTAGGFVEMDAAVMDGAEGRAGAVAGVRSLAHPVRAALAVLEDGRHVLLAGEGAETFARDRGCETLDPQRLVTRRQLERLRGRGHGGTVGAVALDASGRIAAATSTGGTTGKLPGRISDSCQIGAGTWASPSCAVSGTGEGEFFIRCAFAHEVEALLRLAGLELAGACQRALERVEAAGGRGGCIALDRTGNLALPFNTASMARGWLDADGALHVAPA